MYTDIPLVTSAPTGSGKTVIFELAIVRLLMQMVHNISMIKVVYGKQCPILIHILCPWHVVQSTTMKHTVLKITSSNWPFSGHFASLSG